MEKKAFRLSPSAIKTFVSSKAKWAGKYILGLDDSYDNKDALQLGKMFEAWLFSGEDDRSIVEGIEIADNVKFLEDYENLKYNAQGLEFVKGKTQVEVKGELFGMPILGYIDNLSETVDDIKTAYYTTKDNGVKNMRSGMSYRDEYRLQLRIYFKLTGIRHTRILEFGKFKYKDGRKNRQIIDFIWTDELDKDMDKKYAPIVKEMKELYDQFTVTSK